MKKSPENLPIGHGGELEKRKETLPAVEIKNEVTWVNPAFEDHLPFKLERYKPAKLGLFLTPEGKEEDFQVEVVPVHGRSAILGRVIFRDNEGRLYRDIDIKGLGASLVGGRYRTGESEKGIYKVKIVKPVEFREPSGFESAAAEGILDLESARASRDKEEEFLRAGIRTSRSIAFIKPEEIVDKEGQKISVDEAKKQGMIPEEMNPVLLVRAFGTRARVSDLRDKVSDLQDSALLRDAKRLVAQEFGFDEKSFSDDDYFEWFAKTLGENVGRMHREGFVHNYLTGHNVTADCRIVDLDSVQSVKEGSIIDYRSDIDRVLSYAIHDLALVEVQKSKKNNITLRVRLEKIFEAAYEKELGN